MGKEAVSIGGNTFQFFTRNPRGGKAKDIDPADAKALNDFMAENGFAKILAHAPYTLNPCAKDEKILEFALMAMEDDLKRMEYVPGNYYNFHPGSHVGQGAEKALKKLRSFSIKFSKRNRQLRYFLKPCLVREAKSAEPLKN